MEKKPLVWFRAEVKTPPFSLAARVEAGQLLRRLQHGENIAMPHSRPMPSIGSHVHELRINDQNQTFRVIYRIDKAAIVIVEVFSKKTPETPDRVIRVSQSRLAAYDALTDDALGEQGESTKGGNTK